MSIRETGISALLLLLLLVAARWIWTKLGGAPPTGPFGYFVWAVGFLGLVVGLSVLGSLFGVAASGIHRLTHAEEIAREARKVRTPAHFFYVDVSGGKGPWQLSLIKLTPARSLIEVEFRKLPDEVPAARLEAMRSIVTGAVERLKKETAPAAWVEAFPALLASLREHELELRGPSDGFHWYDPQEPPPDPTPASGSSG